MSGSVNLLDAYINIIPSTSKIGPSVKSMMGQFADGGRRSGRMFSGAFSAGLGGAIGGIAAQAIGGAIRSAKAGIKGLVDSFSELEDATGAASVVFGDKFMGSIIKQSKTAARTMGMTKAQVIDAANTFGTFGKAAGLSGQELVGFSTRMTTLAGDLSSFKGGSPEEAIMAIGAAMRGESEPIRRYGVLLDDATLKQRALKLGLISTTKGALTPQVKTLAAQAEILAQTTDATGDFLRTQDSTANVAKRYDAVMSNLGATIGQVVAPAFTLVKGAAAGAFENLDARLQASLPRIEAFWQRFGTSASAAFQLLKTGNLTADISKALNVDGGSKLVGFILSVREGFQKLAGFAKTVGEVIGRVFSAIGPAVSRLAPDFLKAATALSPIRLVFEGLKNALPAILPVLAQVGQALSSAFTEIAPLLSDVASTVSGALTQAFKSLAPALGGVFTAILPILPKVAVLFGDLVKAIVPVVSTVAGMLGPVIAGVVPIISQLVDVLAATLMPLIPAVGSILQSLSTVFQSLLAAIMPLLPPIFNLVQTLGAALGAILPPLAGLLGTLAAMFASLIAAVSPLLGVITSLVGAGLNVLVAVLTPVINIVSQVAGVIVGSLNTALKVIVPPFNAVIAVVTSFVNLLVGNATSVVSSFATMFTSTFNTISQVTTSVWQAILTTINSAIDSVLRFFSNLSSSAIRIISSCWDSVKNTTSSVWNSIRDVLSSAWNSIKSLMSSVWNGIKNTLTSAWNSIKSGVSTSISGLITTVAGIPDRILSALGNLGSLLYDSGSALIGGLVGGIKSAVRGAGEAVSGALASIRSYFPHSPAKRGPFSGRGWVSYSGESIGSTFLKSTAGALKSGVGLLDSPLEAVKKRLNFKSSVSLAAKPVAGSVNNNLRSRESYGEDIRMSRAVTVNQYIQTAEVPKDSRLASAGAEQARMIGVLS